MSCDATIQPDASLAGDAFVFGNAVGEPVASVDTAWRAACPRAGIVGLPFYDVRREGGSRLLKGGDQFLLSRRRRRQAVRQRSANIEVI